MNASIPPTIVLVVAAPNKVNPLNMLLIAAADLGDTQSHSNSQPTDAPQPVYPPRSGVGSSDF